MKELLISGLMWFGAIFMFIAAIGIVRLPDLYIRMHAATKVGTLGISGLVLAGMIDFQNLAVTTQGFLVIVFFFLTAPVAAHMISRAAYRTGVPLAKHSVMDEMKDKP
jgi:multicomponent Na+:H+ antiporter subunit G